MLERFALPWEEFTKQLKDVYDGPRYSRATRGRLRQVLSQLGELGVSTTADLTTAMMANYVKFLGEQGTTNPNTVNGYLSAISAACTYAIEERWLDRQPTWRRVRLRPTPMVRNRPPEYERVAELLAHLARKRTWEGRRLCAMSWLVSLTGIRLMEAACGWQTDLSLLRAQYEINPFRQRDGHNKTDASSDIIPLPDVLVTMLSRWLPYVEDETWLFPGVKRRGPWVGGQTADRPLGALQAAAREIGIEHITWHSLRHAYGTFSLERWGVPLWVVQQVMRHTDIRTTQKYLHLSKSPKIREHTAAIGYSVQARV